MTLDDHFTSPLKRSQLRQGLLVRVARMTWVLNTTVLRITHDAIVTSPLRYGLVLAGPCPPHDLMTRVDTQVISIAASRIAGLPLSSRVECLQFISGKHSFRNMYIKQCALFVHSALVSHESLSQQRLTRELCTLFKARTLHPEPKQLGVDLVAVHSEDASALPPLISERTKWRGVHYQQPLATQSVR